MKLIRWVEVRLTGRRHRGNKTKDKSNTQQYGIKSNDTINQNYIQSKSNSSEALVRKTHGSPSFSLERENVNLFDLPSSPYKNVFHNQSACSIRTTARNANTVSPLRQCSSSKPQQSISSPLLATTKSMERSRIKTNPWFRSPWLMRQTYGSSSSTDSGYDHDCNSNNKNISRDTSNFTKAETSNQSMDLSRMSLEIESSSEDFAESTSSSSNSVFSSNSNSIISESTETIWSMSPGELNHQQSLNAATSESGSGQWLTPSASTSSSSLGQRNKEPLRFRAGDANSYQYNSPGLFSSSSFIPAHGSECKKEQKVNKSSWSKKKSYKMLGNAKLPRGNERWISLATEMSSSEDESEDRYVPSPAPHDKNVFEYKAIKSESLSNQFSGRVRSLTPLDWTLEFSSGTLDEAYSSDIESDILKYLSNSCSNSSFRRLSVNPESCDSLARVNSNTNSITGSVYPSRVSIPISPQTDSAIGLSEEMSSTSTTPSIEVKQSEPLAAGIRMTQETMTRENINSGIRNSNEMALDEKVKQLRIELKDIVDVAMLEARQEELKVREGRLAFQRELIQYKRLLLIQTLAGLRQTLEYSADNFY